ncbi:MAG TPA: ThiF family adenylyltransferase, partial [Candidatus Bathyarchaeia archaeon]|nr:ThiF family adenylyltransferase [Candidatus Bathyarchaeia archaeon]
KRNIGILTEEEQQKLRHVKIAIVGCGGVGGAHLTNLIRLGVGNFHIADMDQFDVVNIQRQYGAFVDTIGSNKAESMKAMALAINPHLNIKVFAKGVTQENMDAFLEDVDILLDGIDFFCVDMRRALFMKAKEEGIYTITAGPLGFGSALLVFSPNGMSFDQYFDINDQMSYLKKVIAFAVGLAPSALHMNYINLGKVDPTAKSGPALISACALASALAVTEVIKIVTHRKKVAGAPHYVQFDPFLQKFKKGYLWRANRHPWQVAKRWFLYRKFRKYE